MITYDEEEIEQALYKGAKVAYLYLALKVWKKSKHEYIVPGHIW
jgi:hypothetical protein